MVKIYGANLGDKEGEFKPLSERYNLKSILKIQKMFEEADKKSKEGPIKKMSIKDGLVEIRGGLLNHRCTSNINGLKGISEKGVLASEWFGFIEEEREAVCCAFLAKWNTEEQEKNFSIKGPDLNERKLGFKIRDQRYVYLFFDETHPAMQELVHMDYFEYEKIKMTDPQKCEKDYTPEQRTILNFIEANSKNRAKKFHLDEKQPQCNWLAIPGGIPSRLVNGICIRGIKCDDEYIKKLQKLFPHATIFNGLKQVLYNPETSQFIKIEELQSNTTSDTSELKKTEKYQDDDELQP